MVTHWTSNMETRLDELFISNEIRQCFVRNYRFNQENELPTFII